MGVFRRCVAHRLPTDISQLIWIIDVRTAFLFGALTCLFHNFDGSDIPRRTTYFTGATTIAFKRIYKRIGFICFIVPVNFDCTEQASVHTSPAVGNTIQTKSPVQLSRANDVFLFLFQIQRLQSPTGAYLRTGIAFFIAIIRFKQKDRRPQLPGAAWSHSTRRTNPSSSSFRARPANRH
jgi:hypothetical protein